MASTSEIVDGAKGEISLALTALLDAVAPGAADTDLVEIGAVIGKDLTGCLVEGDAEGVEECKAQLRVLLEIKRIRVATALDEFLDQAIDLAARIGMALLKAALP